MLKLRKEKKEGPKKDHRLHLSTVRLLVASLAITVIVTMLTFTVEWRSRMAELESVYTTEVFKSLDVETLSGERFTGEQLKDAKLTVFNVWTTSCLPCIKEMPDLEQLNHSYEPGTIQVVGILQDATDMNYQLVPECVDEGKNIVETTGVTYPILICSEDLSDFLDTSISATPTTFYVNQEGQVINTTTGASSLENMKATVDQTLEEVNS